MKQKLLVLCGGQSSEHIVSRMSCTSVLNNLNHDKYDITLVGIDLDGKWYRLNLDQDDLSLDVGARVLCSSVSMDKIYTKKILDTVKIPQVKSAYVKKRYDDKLVVITKDFEEIYDVEEYIVNEIGMPCFIKASRSGSSLGCYRCDNRDDLISKLEAAAKYDRHIVVEENIDCIELETAVLGNDDVIVSRVGQIMPHGEFYTFESKYEDAESKTCIPALVDEKIQEKIREYAIKAFKAVDGHGLSRVDFFLDKKTNNIYLNEINTMPGFTKISMYPQLMNDFGISYSDLLDKLIELAMEK